MTEPMNSKVPKIRFKGFAAEWEEKPLGEIADVYQPQTISQRQLTTTGFDVYGANGVIGKYSRYNHEEPQIAVTCRGNTCGTVNFTKRQSWITGNAMVVNIDKSDLVTKPFLFQQLSAQDLKYLITGSGQPQITGTINSHKTSICSPAEQTKLGGYFQEVDRLIGLQQRKHDKLVTLKNAMLHAMFPQPDATTPEIRFQGFSGDWVEKKVGEICGETYGGGTPRTSERKFWEGEIPWIQSSDILEGEIYKVAPRKFISELALRKSPTKLVPGNSIAIVTRVGVGKLALMQFSYAASQDFLSLSKLKLDQAFTVVALSILLQSRLHETQGTSIKGITKEELLAYSFNIPPAIEEQQKIGHYFRTLDELISRHALQLQKLKQLKSACLEKMFV